MFALKTILSFAFLFLLLTSAYISHTWTGNSGLHHLANEKVSGLMLCLWIGESKGLMYCFNMVFGYMLQYLHCLVNTRIYIVFIIIVNNCWYFNIYEREEFHECFKIDLVAYAINNESRLKNLLQTFKPCNFIKIRSLSC